MKLRKTLAVILAVTSLGGTSLAYAENEAVQSESPTTVTDTSAYTDTPVAAAKSVDAGEEETTKPQYVTRQDLDALKDLLDEADKKKWNSGWTVNVNGSVAAGYTSSANGIGGDGKGGFNVSWFSLGLTGNLREDPVEEYDVRYKANFFWVPGKDIGATNGGTANSGNTQLQTPALADAFITVDLNTPKGNLEPFWVGSLSLGQQLIPFGQDNLASEDQRPTIAYAQYRSNFGIGRDIGLKHDCGFFNQYDPGSGITTPVIGYSLAAWNGSGANRLDNNNEKAYNARILITPETQYLSIFRGLSFGGSIYKELVGGNSSTQTVNQKSNKEWFGWELSWLRKPFLLTAEGVYGNNPRLAGTVNPVAPVIPSGTKVGRRHSTDYIATLFWTPSTLPDFQPLYRYDRFESDSDVKNSVSTIHTIGFNYFVWQTTPVISRSFAATAGNRVLKIQANWNLREPAPNKKFTANDYSLLLVASF